MPGGGWSHRRWQSRVEDSWEHNAAQVARDIESVVTEHGPEVVFLAGEPSARARVRKHASGKVVSLLADLEAGGRAEGTSEDAVHEEIAAALANHRSSRIGSVMEEFSSRRGADKAVADGFHAVVEAARAGALETLLLWDQPESTLTLWAGPEPLQLGRTEEDLAAIGALESFEERADEVILRALVAEDADLILLDNPHENLRDGIGALLRFDARPKTPGNP